MAVYCSTIHSIVQYSSSNTLRPAVFPPLPSFEPRLLDCPAMVRSRKPSNSRKREPLPNNQLRHKLMPIRHSASDNDNDNDPARQGLLENVDGPADPDGSVKGKSTEGGRIQTEVFVIACLGGLAVVALFFLVAPWIGSTFKSLSPSSPRFKPVGPPGSITEKTENWAHQGGSWKQHGLDSDREATQEDAPFYNGTHKFRKTVILVSLDGFRAEYLDRQLTPALTSISQKGLKAISMKPQFPSLTFPNHWSIMTGLYPASHGIVSNNFWDPALNQTFNYVDPRNSWDAFWWQGEPIWETAVRAGVRVAVSMWPGPPYTSSKVRPTFWRPYESRVKWWRKIRQVESWLDLPVKDRPQLMALYLPEVDEMGHHYGPFHPKLNQTLQNVDRFARNLHRCLKRRNLLDIVDVIYVSDHGMASSSNSRVVYLDKLLGEKYHSLIKAQDGWPSAGLWFPSDVDTKPILEKLLQAAEKQSGFDVYTHETMPERWHYKDNPRIAPIHVIPRPGWVISTTHEHLVVMNGSYVPKGVHGYDNDHPDMQAIFIAHGPFAEKAKAKRISEFTKRSNGDHDNFWSPPLSIQTGILPSFPNIEIFSLVGKLLNLQDLAPNNCTAGFWDRYF